MQSENVLQLSVVKNNLVIRIDQSGKQFDAWKAIMAMKMITTKNYNLHLIFPDRIRFVSFELKAKSGSSNNF